MPRLLSEEVVPPSDSITSNTPGLSWATQKGKECQRTLCIWLHVFNPYPFETARLLWDAVWFGESFQPPSGKQRILDILTNPTVAFGIWEEHSLEILINRQQPALGILSLDISTHLRTTWNPHVTHPDVVGAPRGPLLTEKKHSMLVQGALRFPRGQRKLTGLSRWGYGPSPVSYHVTSLNVRARLTISPSHVSNMGISGAARLVHSSMHQLTTS